jgi:hypothetical protein
MRAGYTNASPRKCDCGHTREAHLHFRRGLDCGVCGCKRFRKPGSLDPVAVGVWIGGPLLGWAIVIAVVIGIVKFVQLFI